MKELNPAQISVSASLAALVHSFIGKENAAKLVEEIAVIIQNDHLDFLERNKQLDNWLTNNPACEVLGDVLFDLLMVQFLSAEMHDEEYFDSPEWNEIENKTLDRGSEMLNLFLYLSEARETEVEISLEDFLNEFLLVGEDEFQDEYRIYESLIVNEDLIEANLDEIRKIQKTVRPDTGLQDYFVSLVLFFQAAEGVSTQEELIEGLEAFELAILQGMLAFHQN